MARLSQSFGSQQAVEKSIKEYTGAPSQQFISLVKPVADIQQMVIFSFLIIIIHEFRILNWQEYLKLKNL